MKNKPRGFWIHALLLLFALCIVVGVVVINKRHSAEVSAIDEKFDAVKLRPITARDHYRGLLDSRIQIIIFSDPECIYCKNLENNVLPGIEKRYAGKIVIAYRHHLLPRYTRSPREAEAIECAAIAGGEKKFWQYVDRLYRVTPAEDRLDPKELYTIAEYVGVPQATFSQCVDTHQGKARVDEDTREALLNDIVTAPTTVVRSGTLQPLYIPGSYPGPIYAAINSFLERQQNAR